MNIMKKWLKRVAIGLPILVVGMGAGVWLQPTVAHYGMRSIAWAVDGPLLVVVGHKTAQSWKYAAWTVLKPSRQTVTQVVEKKIMVQPDGSELLCLDQDSAMSLLNRAAQQPVSWSRDGRGRITNFVWVNPHTGNGAMASVRYPKSVAEDNNTPSSEGSDEDVPCITVDKLKPYLHPGMSS